MKGTFILLAIAAVCVAAYPAMEESSESDRVVERSMKPWSRRDRGRHMINRRRTYGKMNRNRTSEWPKVDFLEDVEVAEKKQFFSIMKDNTISRSERQEQLSGWASRQDETVQNRFEDYQQKIADFKEKAKMTRTEALEQVNDAIPEVEKILENAELSRNERREQLDSIAADLNDKAKILLKILYPGSFHTSRCHSRPYTRHHGRHHAKGIAREDVQIKDDFENQSEEHDFEDVEGLLRP